jgi:hypothetical protein
VLTPGYILVPVVCLFAIYALLVFHYRLQVDAALLSVPSFSLANTEALTYRQDSFSLRDNFGPYALVATIILALILSILLPTFSSMPRPSSLH